MKRLLPALVLLALLCVAAPALAETKTETYRFPVEVKGYQVKQEMTSGVEHPHVNGHIVGMSTNIVNADGSPVPIQRLMLHHIVFSKLGEQNPLCAQYTGFDANQKLPGLATPLYGAGEEHNILAFPPGYGLKLGANDTWLMTWMLMNHRKVTDHAFIEWKVTYTTDPVQDTHLYWLDVVNCHADPVFNVPGGGKPGSTYTKTAEITMPESGHVVAAGGHVHGGADGLAISQPDCENRTIITSVPAWGMPDHPFYHVKPILHEPGPIAMSGTLSAQGFPVAAGQRIRLTATYDNQYPHTRVMGIAGMYVAPSSGPVDGCGPLPDRRCDIPDPAAAPDCAACVQGAAHRTQLERQGGHDPAPAGQDGHSLVRLEHRREELLLLPPERRREARREAQLAVQGRRRRSAQRDARERPARVCVAELRHEREVRLPLQEARPLPDLLRAAPGRDDRDRYGEVARSF